MKKGSLIGSGASMDAAMGKVHCEDAVKTGPSRGFARWWNWVRWHVNPNKRVACEADTIGDDIAARLPRRFHPHIDELIIQYGGWLGPGILETTYHRKRGGRAH
jgi:hypothetical protein